MSSSPPFKYKSFICVIYFFGMLTHEACSKLVDESKEKTPYFLDNCVEAVGETGKRMDDQGKIVQAYAVDVQTFIGLAYTSTEMCNAKVHDIIDRAIGYDNCQTICAIDTECEAFTFYMEKQKNGYECKLFKEKCIKTNCTDPDESEKGRVTVQKRGGDEIEGEGKQKNTPDDEKTIKGANHKKLHKGYLKKQKEHHRGRLEKLLHVCKDDTRHGYAIEDIRKGHNHIAQNHWTQESKKYITHMNDLYLNGGLDDIDGNYEQIIDKFKNHRLAFSSKQETLERAFSYLGEHHHHTEVAIRHHERMAVCDDNNLKEHFREKSYQHHQNGTNGDGGEFIFKEHRNHFGGRKERHEEDEANEEAYSKKSYHPSQHRKHDYVDGYEGHCMHDFKN